MFERVRTRKTDQKQNAEEMTLNSYDYYDYFRKLEEHIDTYVHLLLCTMHCIYIYTYIKYI